MAIITVHIH